MKIWGYILDMPGRPSPERQREALTFLGASENIFQDQLEAAKRHASAGMTQLVGRNELIASIGRGDRLCVASPMCLGVSPLDADYFLGCMKERDVTIIVLTGDLVVLEPDDTTQEIVDEFKRQRQRYNTAKSRGRA